MIGPPDWAADEIERGMCEHHEMLEGLRLFRNVIAAAGQRIIEAFQRGNKLILMGNGGSACDALHLAAEFVGRFRRERLALPAIALSENAASLTAIGNDYSFSEIFVRQLQAFAVRGDVIVAISTSGQSPNVVQAASFARDLGLSVIALTGCQGGALAGIADVTIAVPSSITARIQEAHILIGHLWCSMVDVAADEIAIARNGRCYPLSMQELA